MRLEYIKIFHSVLRRQVSIHSFEIWIYENYQEFEKYFGEQLCFKLLNLNYKSKFIIEELDPILVRILGYESLEEFNIKDLLQQLVLANEEEFVATCRTIYDKYCNGYNFFRLLALKYIVYDYDLQLNDSSKKAIFMSKYKDEFIKEATRLLSFFELRKIRITNVHEYSDYRSGPEKIEEGYWT